MTSTLVSEGGDFANIGEIRHAALQAGGMDPAGFRFRVAEYDKQTGVLLSYRLNDASLTEAVEEVRQSSPDRPCSSFVLEPVAFIQ